MVRIRGRRERVRARKRTTKGRRAGGYLFAGAGPPGSQNRREVRGATSRIGDARRKGNSKMNQPGKSAAGLDVLESVRSNAGQFVRSKARCRPRMRPPRVRARTSSPCHRSNTNPRWRSNLAAREINAALLLTLFLVCFSGSSSSLMVFEHGVVE